MRTSIPILCARIGLMALLEGGAPAHPQTPQPARTLTVFILVGHALGEAMSKLCAAR